MTPLAKKMFFWRKKVKRRGQKKAERKTDKRKLIIKNKKPGNYYFKNMTYKCINM